MKKNLIALIVAILAAGWIVGRAAYAHAAEPYFRSGTTVAHGASAYYPRAVWHVAGTVSAYYTYNIFGRVYDRTANSFPPVTAQSSSFHFNAPTRDIHADLGNIDGSNHSPCFYLVTGHAYDLESAMTDELRGRTIGPDSSYVFTKTGVCP